MAVILFLGIGQSLGASDGNDLASVLQSQSKKVTQAQRQAAVAARQIAKSNAVAPVSKNLKAAGLVPMKTAAIAPAPGGVPDYVGVANWANSPVIKKFIDSLPGLGYANRNNYGKFIPVGVPDTNTYPGSDYYEIAVVEYNEVMHSELPPTRLRGYVQTNTTDANINTPHYLGPVIIARKNIPVRIKFTNLLPTGADGNLFIPVDTTVMGSGMGPDGMTYFTQNRATLHLHGGRTPWISDGTPHQWITPADEMTPYPKGVSVQDVPDMPDPGPGAMTFFYTNQQSARLMFYHDHAWGITRLNVYAGEAAGYLIRDDTELDLIARNIIPTDEIPLIIQDKSFVDANTVRVTDPTWNWGTGTPDANGVRPPVAGDLWYPHVYVPAQNPYDLGGANPFGRWHYGPWFWPPTLDIMYPPVANPYYDPNTAPWQPPEMPGTPNPSMPGESFFDVVMVNGVAYPTLKVEPKAYRLRILNAANDRFFNLSMYLADPCIISSDGRANTEVNMVPAAPTAGFPATWPVDGRVSGVPNPNTAGPNWIQIGTEGGFLPAPVVIPPQPIVWNLIPTTFDFGNVYEHSLLIAPAERADVIVDFLAFAGKTLILYNDAPAAFPAIDDRYDYYAGAPDLRDTGGYGVTLPDGNTAGPLAGFSPNIRTVMQIEVNNVTPATAFDINALNAEFDSNATTQGVFARSQPPIIATQAAYDSAYNQTFPTTWPLWGYARIHDFSMAINLLDGNTLTLPLQPKALHDEMGAAFDEYGRMSGKMGLEIPFTGPFAQNFVLQTYVDPATELITASPVEGIPVSGDGTQIWKITHNGVDTHPIHFHLFDVQLLNRVGWDGAIRLPNANELGWKDTLRISPLEDTIVALRAVVPTVPFDVPESVRPLNPAEPLGSMMGFSQINPYNGNAMSPPVENVLTNFGWEYVWHCHILSHEEMDMMRPMVVRVAGTPTLTLPLGPSGLTATVVAGPPMQVMLQWTDNSNNETNFRIERATVPGAFATLTTVFANTVGYTDLTALADLTYRYRVIANNATGDSPPSNIVTVIPPTAIAPGVPTTVTATAGNAQATVSFTAPASDGGSPITSYTVTSSPGGITATGTASPITVTGLTNNIAYTFTVTATNAVGTGAASAASNSVTPATTPGAPTIGVATTGNTQATVSFTAPASNGGSPITSYTATSSPGGRTATGTSSPLTVTGLTNGTAYTFTVRATNAVGTGPTSAASNSVTPTAAPVPLAPINVVATAGTGQATIIFSAPPANGSTITRYVVTAIPATPGAALGTDSTLSATARTRTITGLTPGVAYTFTVAAQSAAGTGPSSAPSNSVTIIAPAAPAAPTNLIVTTRNATSVTLGWNDRSNNEQGFYIERSPNGTTGWTQVGSTAANTATFRNTGLTTRTTYSYRVRAYNAAGTSAYSNTLTVTTR